MNEDLALKIASWVALICLLAALATLAVLIVYGVIHFIIHGSCIS